jgi:hypothetical protein
MAKLTNLKKKLANPGERSKLPGKDLSPQQRQQREMNARLAQPIATIPGLSLASPLTERDLAHEAGAATTVRYGPQETAIAQQLAQAVQQKNDTQTWYDDYKNRLQSYQQQVGAYQQGANDAMQRLQQGVTGLGQADPGFVQQQQAGMPQGTAPVGASVGQNANAALSVRQGIAGNYGVNQANVGAANNTYASNLANVVGPQQLLTSLSGKQAGINKVLTEKAALKGEEGAYNQQYRSQKRSDETKNLLAAGALGVSATNARTSATKAVSTAQNQATNIAQRTKAENNRHSVAVQNAQTSADRLAEQERHNQAMEKIQASKAAKTGKAPDWKPSGQQSTGRKQVTSLKSLATKAKGGQAFIAGHTAQPVLSRAEAAKKIQNAAEAPDDPILLTAALDAVYDGHLSPNTVRALIKAGYKPSLIMDALGVKGRGGKKPIGLGQRPTAKLKHV